MADKATNTLFVSKEEKELADEANLKSLRTRAIVQEIAEASVVDGNFDREKFAKDVNKRFKKITQGEVFAKLVDHVAGKIAG